ncbi:hypothetical protein [Flavobacterium sp. GCM10023249]|uniref:hypothetical protein n=1 Tax=unclassified Flavobacterium TaxID=196869 RepID=UPI00362373EF
MQLKLKIHTKSHFPKRGIFIRSASLEHWISEIDRMGFALEQLQVFPVAGTIANQLFGVLVMMEEEQNGIDLGKNSYFQMVENKVFIPERTVLVPEMSAEEFSTVFSPHFHLMHPEIGLCELEEAIDWSKLLQLPEIKECIITAPLQSVKIPKQITSLQISIDQEALQKALENPLTEEEALENLPFNIKKIMAGNTKEIDKLLAYLEKHPEKALQLGIPLDAIGSSRGGNDGRFIFNRGWNVDGFKLDMGGIAEKISWVMSNYGAVRFVFVILFIMSLRSCNANNFGEGLGISIGFLTLVILGGLLYAHLFDSHNFNTRRTYGNGNALIDNHRFDALHQRYEKVAEDYLAKGDYKMAAHIYYKLLKNTYRAATILEEDGLYHEAAVMQLKYNNNKFKAAECYEKGYAFKEALALYTELNEHEKAGDVWVKMGNREEANKKYQLVVDQYLSGAKYIKAALLYKEKMVLMDEARQTVLKGWDEQKDAANCMSFYFSTFDAIEELSTEIERIYAEKINTNTNTVYLQVIKGEFKKHHELEQVTKEIAYEIVAQKIKTNPQIVSELVTFNGNNTTIVKDVIRYKQSHKKKQY